MAKLKFNTRYEHALDQGMVFPEETMTQQQFKDECDINNILRNSQNGILPDFIKTNGKYGDFSDVNTYQEALNTVLFAKEQFSMLPSNIRERFGNDPALFLEFATNDENMEEMVNMGLATQTNPDPVTSEIRNLNKNLTESLKKEDSSKK